VGGGLLLAVAAGADRIGGARAFGSKTRCGRSALRVLSVILYLGRADPAAVSLRP